MEHKQLDKQERFVSYIIKRCTEDTGFAARLRRADNPDTEYQSYDILVSFGVDIEKSYERLPYALIGAALARLQESQDGTASLGKALRHFFEDKEQGQIRIRRLLACQSVDELCRVLRPLLMLIASKSTQGLCHARLLREMTFFNGYAQRTKLAWAKDYYGYTSSEEAEAFEAKSPETSPRVQE